ncbi:MAG: NnrS family protein, partial [Kangiellaceae bacterium]|nr:NnrS family protein [Kangiellaceae bacterium]
IIRKKLYRNLFFVPLLILMSATNFMMHWALINADYQWISKGSHAMVMLVTFLMCVMGGRVIPMFTANGTRTTKVEPIAWLEKLSIISMALVALAFVVRLDLPNRLLAALALTTAIIHFIRCLRWRFWVTFKTPLVWSLHVSYFCITLGLLLLSMRYWFANISFSLALHLLTVGAMGTMILAMISRVSLGHTGRILVVGKTMGVAFLALILAATTRSLMPLISDDYIGLLVLSGTFWGIGYGLFVVKYFSTLTQPRVDGRPG